MNMTHTTRVYNDQGVCVQCHTSHNSIHKHGYEIDYFLTPAGKLFCTVQHEDGREQVISLPEGAARRWIIAQRRAIREDSDTKELEDYLDRALSNFSLS